MSLNALIASHYQQAAVEQARTHGFTYWRALAVRCRMSQPAANGVLGALSYKRLMSSFPLFGHTNGFRLTSIGCKLMQISRSAARPRGEQAWVFRLARLVDCERRGVMPFTPDSLAETYPELRDYLDLADRFVPGVGIELTTLHVDHGGSADRIVSKINGIAARYLKDPPCRRLVWANRLGVRVLTASAGKADAIVQRIARATADPLSRIEIDVVDDLQHLLAGRIS